jgi:hypothetical protein
MNLAINVPRTARAVMHASQRVVVKGEGARIIGETFHSDPRTAKSLVVATLQHRAKLNQGQSQDAFPLLAVEPCGRPSSTSTVVLVFSSSVYVDMLLNVKSDLAKALPPQQPSGPSIIRAPLKVEAFLLPTEASMKRQLHGLAPQIFDQGCHPFFQNGGLMVFDPAAAHSFEVPYGAVLPVDNHPLVQQLYRPPTTSMDTRSSRFSLQRATVAATAAATAAIRGFTTRRAASGRRSRA